MSVLVQISDPHFGTERAHVLGALTEFIRTCKPSLVLLSGDITQRARPSEFAAALGFMQGLDSPRFLAIPGNHDIPLFNPIARLFFPYANYSRAFGDNLEPEYESPSLLVLCLNTTRRYRHKDGEVSRAQIERVARRLREASPQQLRIVVTHQPVHVIRDSDLPRKLWAVQAGTAVSKRVRGDISNSINLLRYEAREHAVCTVERWDYDSRAGAFACVESHELRLDRGERIHQ